MPKSRDILMSMTPCQLVRLAEDDIDVAWSIFNDSILLRKLGYHAVDNRIFGSSHYWSGCWNLFKPANISDIEFSGFLCRFLMIHEAIYKEAKKNQDIIDRLSPYQQDALEAHYRGYEYEKEFHKGNRR